MGASQLVLSLFPGIGLLDMAFEEAGFCIVRGPDLLWGGDIRRFHPPAGKFDGVIGGPPCQAWSQLRHLVKANGYKTAPDLIPEFERCVAEAQPVWFLMENVSGAPEPQVAGYIVRSETIAHVWVGGDTSRVRRFSFSSRDGRKLGVATLALHRADPERAILASGGHRTIPVAIGGNGKRKKETGKHLSHDYWRNALRLQGLPKDFLAEAPFTVAGKIKVVGNGVPLAMGRAVAAAVKRAINSEIRREPDPGATAGEPVASASSVQLPASLASPTLPQGAGDFFVGEGDD